MASYHFSAQMIGRSNGRSVVAAAAYRAGALIERDETGDRQDYRKKGGIVSADLLTPDGAPEWAQDRAQLWNAVEKVEKRKNSQMAREFELALPHELDEDQARELVLTWARDNLVAHGMAADVAIHDPDRGEQGTRNKHTHVLCTTREFDGAGWAKNKNRDWNDRSFLEGLRESWADAQNAALKAAGSAERVDHRSLADQAEAARFAGDDDLAQILDRPPEPRMGVAVSSVELREQRRAARNAEIYRPITDIAARVVEARWLRINLMAAFRQLVSSRKEIEVASSAEQSPPDADGLAF